MGYTKAIPPFRGRSRGRVHGVRSPPPPFEVTCGFLIQLVFCKKTKPLWFIGVEVEQELSAPPPKKNPGSTPAIYITVTSSTITLLQSKCTKQLGLLGGIDPMQKMAAGLKFFCLN